MSISVTGLKNVNRNLKRLDERTKAGVRRGLIKAGFLIKGTSQNLTPVDTSNLKASHYVLWQGAAITPAAWKGEDREVIQRLKESQAQAYSEGLQKVGPFNIVVGVSAYYAVYVHEDLQAFHKVGTAKFLQKAVDQNRSMILRIVQREARV